MLAQVTPRYPPDISGVGDYSALLSACFREKGAPFATLVTSVAGDHTAQFEGVHYLAPQDAEALANGLDQYDRVLLHFSGYGYARRGLCHWLVDGLAQWKAGAPERRLVTVFHEVYATGPIWRSSFWTAGPQKRIAKDLARLSDAGFMTSEGGRDQLARLVPDLQAELLPVFSNMGEPDAPPPLSDRSSRAIVFGGRGRREKVYAELAQTGDAVARSLRQAGVTEIIDIGPKVKLPEQIAGCPVRVLGPLSADEVSTALSDARIGLIDYPGHVFTKSGIAAAYFAHRLAVVNTSHVGGFPTDLKDGEQVLRLETFARSACALQEIADAGHTWYRPHSLDVTVDRFLTCLT